VLCGTLDAATPDEGWDRVGHHHLQAAVAAVDRQDASLFTGLAGVGFAALVLSGGRPRYDRLLRELDRMIEPAVAVVLHRLDGARGCRVTDFDLVCGLAGIGVYLLERATVSGQARTLLDRLLAGLVELLGAPEEPRRWHTPGPFVMGPLREVFPGGLYNCGLAHGVPGPLALMALAVRAGVRVPGDLDAVATIAEWLAAHQTGTGDEPDWPDGVALAGPPAPQRDRVPGRAAWCYGAPGVARSLWLAGVAAGEPSWQALAARTVRAVAARPMPSWRLTMPGFCHGGAGLLQVLRRFADELGDPMVGAAADVLAADLAGRYDDAAPFGVQAVEPDGSLVDLPGLLEGATGVALALHGPSAGRAWDRMFLLA
jgi:hypothetical protein